MGSLELSFDLLSLILSKTLPSSLLRASSSWPDAERGSETGAGGWGMGVGAFALALVSSGAAALTTTPTLALRQRARREPCRRSSRKEGEVALIFGAERKSSKGGVRREGRETGLRCAAVLELGTA